MTDASREEGRHDPELHRTVRSLKLVVGVLALAVAGLGAWMVSESRGTPTVLAVERLDIVEADGTPALVLSNSQRVPPATLDGQVIMGGQEEERRGAPGIIFFDGRGDEVGGLIFGNLEDEDGTFRAMRHFSLDGYKQDQTVVIHHYQDPGGAVAGISVTDRPWDTPMFEAMATVGLEPGATREEIQRAFMEIPEEDRDRLARELFGVQRLFLGSSREDQAALVMRDGQGRPRIWIAVPLDGDPSIRILDEDGEVVATLP